MSSKTSPSTAKTSSRKPRQSSRKVLPAIDDKNCDVPERLVEEENLDLKAKPARRTAAKASAAPAKKTSKASSIASEPEDGEASSTASTTKKRRATRVVKKVNDPVASASTTSAPEEKPASKRKPRKKKSEPESLAETPAPSEADPAKENVLEIQPEIVAAPKRRNRRKSAVDAPTNEILVETAPPIEDAADEATALSGAPPVSEEPLPGFDQLGLSAPLLKAIEEIGYKTPTPIQARAIPFVLQKRDVLGVAQTGTGKTASFTLPMLELLAGSRARARMPRSLVLEPTRELALQVSENLTLYGKHLKLNHALLIGGESMMDQRAVLNQGVDILIATPGRLMDLFERGGLLLNQASILVIDEADRMLDMGFIPDIQKIVNLLPSSRQTLFFSATMASEIRSLADQFLVNPEEITVSRPSSVATTIEEALIIVEERDKRRTLRALLQREHVQNAIVFCNRKRDVDVLYKSLHKHGFSVGHLHGDLPQATRFKTLERFKNDEIKILVCSDVAARGIDIGGLSHVFNFDLPFNAEDYVHRIGRTGRAGRSGHAYSLATPEQKPLLDAIEALTHTKLPQPAIEGINQLAWGEAQDDRARRGKSTARPGQKDRKAQDPIPPRAPTAEEAPTHGTPRRDAKRRPTRNERDLLPMEADHVGPGFGTTVPSFMNAPRRKAPSRVQDESQAAPSTPKE